MREHDDFSDIDDDFDKKGQDGDGASANFDGQGRDRNAGNDDFDDGDGQKPVDQKPVDQEPVDQEPVDQEPVDQEPVDEDVDAERDRFDLVERVCTTNYRYVIANAFRIAAFKTLLAWTREDVEAYTAAFVEDQARAATRNSGARGAEKRRLEQFLRRYCSRDSRDWQLGVSRAAFTRMLMGRPVDRFSLYILEETFRHHLGKRDKD